MSRPAEPAPCALLVAVLRSPQEDPGRLTRVLGEAFGAVREATPEAPFTHSAYYEREMGSGLLRSYLALGRPRHPEELASLKLAANALEAEWSQGGPRRVNLDPGLLNLTQVVLATGKPAAHRVYLDRGIYAEVELVFERGSFRPLPWTYPDYREPHALGFFDRVREGHRTALKESR